MINKKITTKMLDDLLLGINQNLLANKVIHDAKKHGIVLKHQDLEVGVTIFIEGEILRSVNIFNNRADTAIEGSRRKGLLISRGKNPMGVIASAVKGQEDRGAMKANGLVVSTDGFKDVRLSEYFSWLILNGTERRLEEVGMSLGDTRFREYISNIFITEEMARLKGL